jgi:glutaredoxin 3
MSIVIVYTTDPCARCGKAKAILDRREIAYREVNLAKDPDGRAQLVRKTGMMTFPQIMIGDQTVGGLDDLEAADRDGRLAAMVTADAG